MLIEKYTSKHFYLSWYQGSSQSIHSPFFLLYSQRIFTGLHLMAIETNSPSIVNTREPHQTLISINVVAQTPLKLISTNYLLWKLRFQTLFIGYDLLDYIYSSNPCPLATITQSTTTRRNPS